MQSGARRWARLFFFVLGWQPLLAQRTGPPAASLNGMPGASANAAPAGAGQAMAPETAATTTTLEVKANAADLATGLAPVVQISGREILSSAGTYGDVSRYLQVLPGAVAVSDLSNGVLVRGGNPEENLFVIDGVEFPGISHFSLPGSGGGFTSMIDATAVGGMSMRPGPYDASYASRLSSAVEIETRPQGSKPEERMVTVGISGAGGLYARALPGNGSILLSAHRSILNFFTNDIGIGGVPIYSNGLARVELNPDSRDSVELLSLSGADEIEITPCAGDSLVESAFETQYTGWRSTDALTWKHTLNAQTVTEVTASESLTRQNIAQEEQQGYVVANNASTCAPLATVGTYAENSLEGLPRLKAMVRTSLRGWLVMMGADGGLIAPDARVTQPVGQLTPFSTNQQASDAVAFERKLVSGETAGFVQAEGTLGKRWQVMGGLRAETFALDGSSAMEPRVSVLYRLNGRQSLHASWNHSAQLPPTLDLISYAENRRLQPIEDRQITAGMRLWQGAWGTLDAEAYDKAYTHEPVSTQYPQLMLFNMVNTLGQSFAWLPLVGSGSAEARGLELTLRARWGERVSLLASAARAQSSYRALDGLRRTGNYDVPVAVNTMSHVRLPLGLSLNARETLTSGPVYCPFDLEDSLAQNRGIYNLAQINAVRGPLYNRLDAELERSLRVRGGTVEIQGGAENLLNRGNLQGFVWLENCGTGSTCNRTDAPPVGKLDQMGRYPEFAARYRF
jgi:TonB dependent receptor/TonB-dependent Receptor Plug Domain